MPKNLSKPMTIAAILASGGAAFPAHCAPVELFDQAPVEISSPAQGVVLVDFGRVAFGNLRLTAPAGVAGEVTVHFGEDFKDGRINREPPGTVRYAVAGASLEAGKTIVVAPPADKRNTEQVSPHHPPAILTPPEWGVVLPFRWVEIEGWTGEISPEHITRQAAFAASWDDDAAAFSSSDEILDQIWELCRYSIKATTFAGVYVDGDRERIPYEADAYLNQLSHYASDPDPTMARDTYDWLMKYPTWPTEWASHMIFMAHADWMQTGDLEWLTPRYEPLKSKLLLHLAREDGLVVSPPEQVRRGDLVDWPPVERDEFDFTPVNTVINAFHYRTLILMAELAEALDLSEEKSYYTEKASRVHEAFNRALFDEESDLYLDGEGSEHSSQHANFCALAFGLVPEARREHVTQWLVERGMGCSVYAAQYLLEALFENSADEEALALITAPTDRSWRHMLKSGTTITWEAWDEEYKPNLDWNHAWGAAPANLLSRYVLGVQPLTPGWKEARIRPHLSGLSRASGKVPTPHGPIKLSWVNEGEFHLKLQLPDGISAKIELPDIKGCRNVLVNGKRVKATAMNARWILESEVGGEVEVWLR
jgi:hypothetical protein